MKIYNKNNQNTIKVPIYQNIVTRAHHIISHTTFAKFNIIFKGADEEFESISDKLFFLA